MSKSKARRGAPVKDKWRSKTWYEIFSPSYFNNVEIASTPASDEGGVLDRIFETTLYELTDDFTKSHITLHFQANDIKGDKAYTIFKGHSITRDYLRSLIRRGTSRIDTVTDVVTKDGYKLRITAVVFTQSRGKTSQQHAIRKLMTEQIIDYAKETEYEQFAVDLVNDPILEKIDEATRTIMPIRRVEIIKSRLRSLPAK